MEFVFTTNLAYFVLVIGFLLAVFALLTPGTGIFELGALAALVFSAWAIASLPTNTWALVLLLVGVFPFLLALRRTQKRIYLLISALALMIGSAYLFQGSEWWLPGVHPALAFVVSVSAGGLLWFMAVKVLEAGMLGLSHDISGLVGMEAETRTKVHHEGSVYTRGEMWAARSKKPIPSGRRVRVTAREGLILDVEPLED
ncbi:MAG: hypothetical protein OEV06_00680 [Anaerolineae bacterium]|nr:hypothetical protein [Anaerolineae bacterium]